VLQKNGRRAFLMSKCSYNKNIMVGILLAEKRS
jgi:hypothetical protein